MAIAALVAGIASAAAKGISGGIAKMKGSKASLHELKQRRVAGSEQGGLASAYLQRALRGQAVTGADIAPQIQATREAAGQSRQALVNALQTAPIGQGFSVGAIQQATGQQQTAELQNIRNIYATQLQMNQQAKQQAAQTAIQASGQQAQLDRQRDVMRGQLKGDWWKGLAGAITATRQ